MEVLGVGMDVCSLFILFSVIVLEKVVGVVDVIMFNFILVYCCSLGKFFYVILYCIDIGLVIDFEFVCFNDVIVFIVGVF